MLHDRCWVTKTFFFFFRSPKSSKMSCNVQVQLAPPVLTPNEIMQRNEYAKQQIPEAWALKPGHSTYLLNCLCSSFVCHRNLPVLKMDRCYAHGELCLLTLTQPFLENYGFRIRQHCADESCQIELCCCEMK